MFIHLAKQRLWIIEQMSRKGTLRYQIHVNPYIKVRAIFCLIRTVILSFFFQPTFISYTLMYKMYITGKIFCYCFFSEGQFRAVPCIKHLEDTLVKLQRRVQS